MMKIRRCPYGLLFCVLKAGLHAFSSRKTIICIAVNGVGVNISILRLDETCGLHINEWLVN